MVDSNYQAKNLRPNRKISDLEIRFSKAKSDVPKCRLEHYDENSQCITRDNFKEFVL